LVGVQLGVAAEDQGPILVLAIVDLAQVQHLPLYHPAARATLALDNIPRAMFFAVFEASVKSQEHDANQLTPNQINEKIRTRMYGGVGEEEPRGSPYPDRHLPAKVLSPSSDGKASVGRIIQLSDTRHLLSQVLSNQHG
jgi:hypothetical protein